MFKVNNKDTPGVVLVSLLLTRTFFTPYSGVSFVNYVHVNEIHKTRIIFSCIYIRTVTVVKAKSIENFQKESLVWCFHIA